MKVSVNRATEVSFEEALDLIRDYIKKLPPPKESEFKVGDVVRLDTGWPGIVSEIDSDGTVYVCYINDNGDICGPAYGYSLEKWED